MSDEADKYADPKLECDVVMKGGITSGVVYPGAVVEMAQTYRFRSVGGASAGAIAAAVVGAAEYSRSVKPVSDTSGFTALEALPETMGGSVDGQPFILTLFQPDKATRPLFDSLIAFMRWGLLRGLWTAILRFWRFPVVAFLVVLGAISLSVFADARAVFLVVAVAAALWILVIGLGSQLFRALLALADNSFGLCRLGPLSGSEAAPALTVWLHQQIQAYAGRGDQADARPLTFADLWGAPDLPAKPTDADYAAHRETVISLSRAPQTRNVDLQMMTTSLTHGRPLRLPVPFQTHEELLEDCGRLLYDPEELSAFFPQRVIDHLTEFGDPLTPETLVELTPAFPRAAQLRHFPIGPDLPIVVATRMSLSFPILISALPLWEIDFATEPGTAKLRRVIFSDGGITSNFPVHFFDSPLPTRPTFGLHLAGFAAGEEPDPADPSRSVDDPARVNGMARESWVDFDTVFGFLTAIKDAAQNWRDNAQSQLPGFRERIIHIKLARGEGGLNLAMKQDKIEELTARGRFAGDRLVELFDCSAPEDPSGCRWNDHRFARYRTTMSLIERHLRAFERGYRANPDAVSIPYPRRIAEGRERPPYRFESDSRLEMAQRTTLAYLGLVDGWGADDQTLDDANVPRPPSTLRAVPPV